MKSTINIRIDSELKNNAENVISELGLSLSSAITIFLKAVVRTESLPFEVRMGETKKSDGAKTPDKTKKVIKQSSRSEGKSRPKRNAPAKKTASESIRRAIDKL